MCKYINYERQNIAVFIWYFDYSPATKNLFNTDDYFINLFNIG